MLLWTFIAIAGIVYLMFYKPNKPLMSILIYNFWGAVTLNIFYYVIIPLKDKRKLNINRLSIIAFILTFVILLLWYFLNQYFKHIII
jgi:hypothetical protein